MRYFVVPILVEFEMTYSESVMTLWAGTNIANVQSDNQRIRCFV